MAFSVAARCFAESARARLGTNAGIFVAAYQSDRDDGLGNFGPAERGRVSNFATPWGGAGSMRGDTACAGEPRITHRICFFFPLPRKSNNRVVAMKLQKREMSRADYRLRI
jgi:hypothetical protein